MMTEAVGLCRWIIVAYAPVVGYNTVITTFCGDVFLFLIDFLWPDRPFFRNRLSRSEIFPCNRSHAQHLIAGRGAMIVRLSADDPRFRADRSDE